MSRPRIAVLRGGPGEQGRLSLKEGKAILSILAPHYRVLDVLVTPSYSWAHEGVTINPEGLSKRADGVFTTIKGASGVGELRHLLESHSIPFNGAGRFGTALSLNIPSSRDIYSKYNIKTPVWRIISNENETIARDLFHTFPLPARIRPLSQLHQAPHHTYRSPHEIADRVSDAFQIAPTMLIEEHIDGKEVSCAVIENFRGMPLYVSPVIEYSGTHGLAHPARITSQERDLIQEYSRLAHQSLGLRHMSHSRFVVHPRRGVYIISTDPLPDLLHPEASATLALHEVGVTPDQIIIHLADLALKRK